jgi:hypothetical protein
MSGLFSLGGNKKSSKPIYMVPPAPPASDRHNNPPMYVAAPEVYERNNSPMNAAPPVFYGPKTRNNTLREHNASISMAIATLEDKRNKATNRTNKRLYNSRINRLKAAVGHLPNSFGYGWHVEPANNGYLNAWKTYPPVAAPPSRSGRRTQRNNRKSRKSRKSRR